MSGARQGRAGTRAERKACAALEADGYLVTRAAGSLGLFDLVAVGLEAVLLVQVKRATPGANTNGRTIAQYREIAALTVAPFVRKQVWIYRPRARAPEIRELPDELALEAWRGRRRAREPSTDAERTASRMQLPAVPA